MQIADFQDYLDVTNKDYVECKNCGEPAVKVEHYEYDGIPGSMGSYEPYYQCVSCEETA